MWGWIDAWHRGAARRSSRKLIAPLHFQKGHADVPCLAPRRTRLVHLCTELVAALLGARETLKQVGVGLARPAGWLAYHQQHAQDLVEMIPDSGVQVVK